MPAADNAAAVRQLDELTRELRERCPWDREQDERSIVPHTVEEAYELADAARTGDDRRLIDELGDVLFQVHFLSLLLEERGAGDLATVAEHCRTKLIRRHPHVFGEVEAGTSGEVLANWDRIKQGEAGREEGLFGEVPENLPGLLHARKVQRRAASTGFDPGDLDDAVAALADQAVQLGAAVGAGDPVALDGVIGDLLFAAVNVARRAKVDPELALRSATDAFRLRVERAVELAAADSRAWQDLDSGERLRFYALASLEQENR